MAPAPPFTDRADLRRWAVDIFLPFWATHGFDADHGCFFELLDRSGAVVPTPATRSRVQARQAYTMAAGLRLTGEALYRTRLEAALDFLLAHGRRPDGLIAAALTPDGRIAEATAPLYDQAFALFALGHGIAASPARAGAYRAAADSLWQAISDRLAHPAGGFREQAEGTGPRQQNPHMHLLEATLALWEATGDRAWQARAADLVALFDRAFFDPDTASVTEFLSDDLTAPDPETGRLREPGHGCEWAWLLDRAGRLGAGPMPHPASLPLWRAAATMGQAGDAPGLRLTMALPAGKGDPPGWVDPVRRVWPQTEAIKAALTVARLTGAAADRAAVDRRLDLLFTHWLDPAGPLWIERLTPTGAPVDDRCPASTPYHIMVAVEEALADGAPDRGAPDR